MWIMEDLKQIIENENKSKLSMIILFTSLILASMLLAGYYCFDYANAQTTRATSMPPPLQSAATSSITIKDPNLKAKMIFTGLRYPSSMAFLGPNDILVLEKNAGTVRRIVNGTMLPQPLLTASVANKEERGMVGIAVAKHQSGPTYVFLYYTQSGGGKTGDDVSKGIQPAANVLYRYEFVNNKLVNPKLLQNLPAVPGPDHNGGKMLIGPDSNLYLAIGDVGGHRTQAQNIQGGFPPDGTSGILRMTQDGKPVKGILGNDFPLNLYYAYGVRNSFGLDFDPVAKNLWDAENGPCCGDAIYLVKPGHNSGWRQITGIWRPIANGTNEEIIGAIIPHPEKDLVDFGGKGKYSPPQFTWRNDVGPTQLRFLNSTKLGKQYQNDMFVGEVNDGSLYHFKLNQTRTGLLLNNGTVPPKVVYTEQQKQQAIFAQGFGGITDIQLGPDGYLYILTLLPGAANYSEQESGGITGGTIYRIEPANTIVK